MTHICMSQIENDQFLYWFRFSRGIFIWTKQRSERVTRKPSNTSFLAVSLVTGKTVVNIQSFFCILPVFLNRNTGCCRKSKMKYVKDQSKKCRPKYNLNNIHPLGRVEVYSGGIGAWFFLMSHVDYYFTSQMLKTVYEKSLYGSLGSLFARIACPSTHVLSCNYSFKCSF